MRISKRKFESQIASNCKINPKPFWVHVRRKLKTKTGVSPLLKDIKDKKSLTFNDEGKADILQNQFSSVYTKEPQGELPIFDKRVYSDLITKLDITEEMVRKEILKLNPKKSCGPDEISPKILIEIVDYLSLPIAQLINKTLKEGIRQIGKKQ